MSAVVSMSGNYSIYYLTEQVAKGRENYYTDAVDAGEPPGRWYGAGAEALGLDGEADEDMMTALYLHRLDPRDPKSRDRAAWGEAETLGGPAYSYRATEERYQALLAERPQAGPEERDAMRRQAARDTRQSVAFFDATFSPDKSVTVLATAFERAENAAHERARQAEAAGQAEQAAEARREQAAWAAHRGAVEQAVMAGARASIDYLEDQAGYSRRGHHGGGAGRWIDAHRFVAAQFLQHDSRDRDPQLHVHQAILNSVQGDDGEWRTLDSKALFAHKRGAAAHGERVMESVLTRALGVVFEMRPDGRAREIVGVDRRVMSLFSSRTRAITPAVQRAVDEFSEVHGRSPSPLELAKITQQATLSTRRAKSHEGETAEDRAHRWERECRTALDVGLAQVARDALAAGRSRPEAERWSASDVISRALDRVSRTRQTWRRPELVAAISEALPGRLGLREGAVGRLLERLADEALKEAVVTSPAESTADMPADMLLRNGQSPYQNPVGPRYAARGQIAAERAIEEAGRWRGAPHMSHAEAQRVIQRYAENGYELGADQRAAVEGILTSDAAVEVLAAPAGAGKSFVIGAIADAWTPGRVVGLAPSQAAANVLTDEGVTSFNLTAWLGQQQRGENPVQPGDLVFVDEAGMAPTPDLAKVIQLVEAAGGKARLVGDPRQLGAVGPGGVLADHARSNGANTYELTEVRRFQERWEGPASLRLRGADANALDLYDKHGRLRDGGTADEAGEAAARAWTADRLAGKDSLLIVGTNAEADKVSASLRARLVRMGLVAEEGVPLGRDGNMAGVGDRVQARRNAWELAEEAGRAPINRDVYTVTAIHPSGGLTVVDAAGVTMELPASYVAEDVALSYATTVHGAQGRTVDTAHTVIAPGQGAGSVYVSMTRGREANTAWVVTRQLADGHEPGDVVDQEGHPDGAHHPGIQARSPRAVVEEVLASAADERGALAEIEQAAEEAASTRTNLDRLTDGIAEFTAGRVPALLDELHADGVITDTDRQNLAADRAMGAVGRLLRGAELRGRDVGNTLRTSLEKPLTGAKSAGQVLFARVQRLTADDPARELTGFDELIPAGLSDDRRRYLETLAEAADDRRRVLGSELAADPPAWAVERLGPVPEDAVAREEWEQRAGWAAAWRENQDHTADEPDVADGGITNAGPLGAAPPAGLAEKRAVYATAAAALGGEDTGVDEAGMTDGQLRRRVQAYENERRWAPRFVDDELAATAEAQAAAEVDAALWARERDDANREAAERARAEAEHLRELRGQLAEVDDARSRWFAAVAPTKEVADRARAMLKVRGADLDAQEDRVTAEEWLAADERERARTDRYRPVNEEDLADHAAVADDAAADAVLDEADELPVLAETGMASTAEADASEYRQPAREVPEDEPTAEAVDRARDVLDEIADRHSQEDAHGEHDDEAERPWWFGLDDAPTENADWTDRGDETDGTDERVDEHADTHH